MAHLNALTRAHISALSEAVITICIAYFMAHWRRQCHHVKHNLNEIQNKLQQMNDGVWLSKSAKNGSHICSFLPATPAPMAMLYLSYFFGFVLWRYAKGFVLAGNTKLCWFRQSLTSCKYVKNKNK